MSAKEGVSRIAKAVSVVSWIAIAGGLLTTVSLSMMARRDVGIVFFGGLLASFVVWGLCQGLVWIIDGFVGNKNETSSLLWPVKRKRRLRPALDESDSTPAQKVSYMNSRPDLYGVGGWLLFFVISFTVITPLAVLGSTANNFSQTELAYPVLNSLTSWGNYKTASFALAFLVAGMYGWCGKVLWTQHIPQSVKTAILALWILPLFLGVGDVMLAMGILELHLHDAVDGRELVSRLFGYFMPAAVWTLYLKLSRRVRNTYFNKAGFA